MPGGVADPRRGVAASLPARLRRWRVAAHRAGLYTRLMHEPRLLLAAISALSLVACYSGCKAQSSSGTTTTDGGPIGGARPVLIHVPPNYQQGTPVPLVLMLHGYGADDQEEELYLGIT